MRSQLPRGMTFSPMRLSRSRFAAQCRFYRRKFGGESQPTSRAQRGGPRECSWEVQADRKWGGGADFQRPEAPRSAQDSGNGARWPVRGALIDGDPPISIILSPCGSIPPGDSSPLSWLPLKCGVNSARVGAFFVSYLLSPICSSGLDLRRRQKPIRDPILKLDCSRRKVFLISTSERVGRLVSVACSVFPHMGPFSLPFP